MDSIEAAKAKFPRQPGRICLNHCRVSPLYRPAAEREAAYALGMADGGIEYFFTQLDIMPRLRAGFGKLLNTTSENITFTKSCAEGLNFVAQGFGFRKGDEVVSFANEFPSNHFPWRVAEEKKGVILRLLPNRNTLGAKFDGRICAWSMDDLERLVTPQTRIVALSHVQFTSGFACDLLEVGAFCRERGIYFVVDAAQSLGAMPIDVEAMNIAALASSGWKWLMGPFGSAMLYTSPEFRRELELVFPGPASMEQPGPDYLDLTWRPLNSGAKFEMSAVPLSLAAALSTCVEELFLKVRMDEVWREILRLQDLLLAQLEGADITPARFSEKYRSPILSLLTTKSVDDVQKRLLEKGIVASARDQYLRLSPHFYNTDEEMTRAGTELVKILRG